MELGEKLKLARLEAGLSQRQLCGEEITRNMLSQIENGSASPSMNTLRFLAKRLGKSMSYFLDEEAVVSPNQGTMEQLRIAFDKKQWERVWGLLKQYQKPDLVFDREQALIRAIAILCLAEKALDEGKERLAKDFLEKELSAAYFPEVLEERRQLLLGRLPGMDPREIHLPNIDQQLLLRAEAALAQEDTGRAGVLLDAAEDHNSPRWNLLRGNCYKAAESLREAVACYRAAEIAFPQEAWAGLEDCYSQLRDFENAYIYACKRRQ